MVKLITTGMAFILCAMFIGVGIDNLTKSILANHWEVHQGKALRPVSGKIQFKIMWHRFGNSRADVAVPPLYTYVAEERRYKSATHGFGATYGGPEVPRGGVVTVYVNPLDPSESTLVAGVTWGHAIPFIFALLFYFLSLFFLRKV